MAEENLIAADEQHHEESGRDQQEEAPAGENHRHFDPMKKKKKKKVRFEGDVDLDAMAKVTEKVGSLSLSIAGEVLESSFAGLKKKKKKRPVDGEPGEVNEGHTTAVTNGEEVSRVGEEDEAEATVLDARFPWERSNRDYTYNELLGRVFNTLRENNPQLGHGEKRRTIMRPPQVLREGTKKVVFVNLMDICNSMHRQPDHVMKFLFSELGTTGNLDGQQRLVVKGRFLPKAFEGLLRRYVNEYVICNGCKCPDTILTKESRLFFLRCEQCGCSRSVLPIKSGYVARVGRRKTTT